MSPGEISCRLQAFHLEAFSDVKSPNDQLLKSKTNFVV